MSGGVGGRQEKSCLLPDISTDSPQINTARVAHRVLTGGHDVPIPKIVSRYYKSMTNCGLLASIVDRLYVYDNSVENVFPQLLFRAVDGKLTKQYVPIHDWASIIFRAVMPIAVTEPKS